MYLSRSTKKALRMVTLGAAVGGLATVLLLYWWQYVVGAAILAGAAWGLWFHATHVDE
jgi:hypothetical protein